MAKETLAKVMPHVFESEGGYVDHPADPGGATKYGITIGTLSRYRGRPASKADVKNLTKAEAAKIYRSGYWAKVKGDDLPAGVDWAVFDYGINSGPARAIRDLQKAVGATADGVIGPKTMAAVNALDAATVVNRLCDIRLAFLKALPTWKTFGKGWGARVAKVRSTALAMVEAPVPPPPDVEPAPDPDLDMRRMPEGGGMYVAGGLALMAAVIGAAMWWFG